MSAKKVVEKVAKHLSSKKHEVNMRQLDDGSVLVRHSKEGEYLGNESSHKSTKQALKHVGGLMGMVQAHSGKPIGKIKDMGGDKDDEQ